MDDIIGYESFTKIEPINKGWSNDKKYYIETNDNRKLLLRVSDIAHFNHKSFEFEMMKQVAALNIPMSQPLAFGTCDDDKSVYILLTWCDGEDAESILPRLSETEQYTLGVKSGEILKSIHSIPAPAEQEEWEDFFNRKVNNKMEQYKTSGVRFDGDHFLIDYIERNRHLLKGRPQCYQHGDYHTGNMVISATDHMLSIIDFNRHDFGDPWEELNRIVFSAKVSPHFATGQLNGYFGGKPPIDFFQLLALYISSNTLSAIYWALSFDEEEMVTMKNQASDVLAWFNHMRHPIPTWYISSYLDF
ncbi:aminoglycoside phosphotransferase family protein [Amphibacillus sp. Q70]|uniref:aminoglycoside phosphotransferase family protein n=1 Tax=Amphibacillus sp. Q70 TaxID=3453416 RepID=UPI003F824E53